MVGYKMNLPFNAAIVFLVWTKGKFKSIMLIRYVFIEIIE